MANQTFNALAGLGQSIGQGIQMYAENQRKSEAADATIASGVANSKSLLDIWGQDPEFAPIVAQFAQRLEKYKDAPSQSYAKKAVMANEIGMLNQEFAQTIQAYQTVRGRQIERVGGELLNQYKNVQSVTDPAFVAEGVGKMNTGKSYVDNENEWMQGVNKFVSAADAAGKKIKGTETEARDAYRRGVVDVANKAMSAGTLDKGIGSRILEQVEAQRSIEKKNAQAQSDMPVLPSMAKSSLKDYESVTGTAYQAPVQAKSAEQGVLEGDAIARMAESASKNINEKRFNEATTKSKTAFAQDEVRKAVLNIVAEGKAPTIANFVKQKENIIKALGITWDGTGYVDKNGKDMDWVDNSINKEYETLLDKMGFKSLYTNITNPSNEKDIAEQLRTNPELQTRALGAISESKSRSEKLDKESMMLAKAQPTTAANILARTQPQSDMSKAPVLSLGKMAVGQVEYERKVNQAEKKAKIADLMTQRIGIVDPATGKKSLPAGFEAYYKKMVPESDARVVDIDGVKLLWDGSKFEQVKMEQAKIPTAEDIGKEKAYTFGVRTENGIMPTELVPESGVLFAGIVSAATAAQADKVRNDLTDLTELRGVVKRLQDINDKFGESVNLQDIGYSKYDILKLRAVLTKEINISGAISDMERKEVLKMAPDPTGIVTFEKSDRANLQGIYDGITRGIKNKATSHGLSVQITENGETTQNQLNRQKYLANRPK